MKVGEDDKLFGSVTSQMIADALKEKGFTVDKRTIELEEPIKTLGIFEVPVNSILKSVQKRKCGSSGNNLSVFLFIPDVTKETVRYFFYHTF